MIGKDKITTIGRRVVAGMLSAIAIFSIFQLCLGYAVNTRSSLGTNKALGSPMLNSNFMANDWNSWEMLVWGIYLSNFVTPLADDYNSAFNMSATTGSKGAGIKALQFGSGNDVESNKNIKSLLEYAITAQTASGYQTLYKEYTPIVKGIPQYSSKATSWGGGSVSGQNNASTASSSTTSSTTSSTPTNSNNGSTTSGYNAPTSSSLNTDNPVTEELKGDNIARFRDIMPTYYYADNSDIDLSDQVKNMMNEIWKKEDGGNAPSVDDMNKVGMSWASYLTQANSVGNHILGSFTLGLSGSFRVSERLTSALTGVRLLEAGQLATVYNAKGAVLFDLTDSYDSSMVSACLGRVLTVGDEEVYKQVEDAIDALWKANPEVVLDCFGNIVVRMPSGADAGKYKVVIPAAVNQHLTNTPKQNLINSWVINGNALASTEDTLVKYIAAAKEDRATLGSQMFISQQDIKAIQAGALVFGYDTDTELIKTMIEENRTQKSSDLTYGKVILNLFENDISKSGTSVPLRIHVAGLGSDGDDRNFWQSFTVGAATIIGGQEWLGWWKDTPSRRLNSAYRVSNSASVYGKGSTNIARLTYIKPLNGGDDIPVFGDSVVTSVGDEPAIDKFGPFGWAGAKVCETAIPRYYLNYLNKIYNGKISPSNGVTKDTIVKGLSGKTTPKEVVDWMFTDGNIINPLYSAFVEDNKVFYDQTKLGTATNIGNITKGDGVAGPFFGQVQPSTEIDYWYPNNEDGRKAALNSIRRLVKVYPRSNVMTQVSNVLDIRENTDFAAYASMIYLTYLDWYGLIGNKNDVTGAAGNSNSAKNKGDFNTKIFDEQNAIYNQDADGLLDVMSEEDKKRAVLDNTYLLLNKGNSGRQYRAGLLMNWLSDFLHRSYQSTVYGNVSDYYSGAYSQLQSNVSNGFLKLNSYADNPWTAWVMKHYSTIVIYGLVGTILAVIIIGILKTKKISWFFMAIAVVVNSFILMPSMGEITPYVSDKIVQGMFKDNMSYWTINESISNLVNERRMINSEDSLTGEVVNLSEKELVQANNLIKTLNVLYLDRSLMIKQDISKKVIKTADNFDEIQKLATTRWMIPLMMRQFTARDGSANYVMASLADLYDNMSNIYWYYNPIDGNASGTVSGSGATNNAYHATNLVTASEKVNKYFADYRDTSFSYKLNNLGTYGKIVLTSKDSTVNYGAIPGWQSVSRNSPDTELPHTTFYMLTTLGRIPSRKGLSWDEYINKNVGNNTLTSNFRNALEAIGRATESYDYSDASTVSPELGYVWMTENPATYFYQVVKDTFGTGHNLTQLSKDLQGEYKQSENYDYETRRSFMHYEDTGKVVDILDMEELFSNVIPYLYQVQLLAGGGTGDGNTGVFGDEVLTEQESKIYYDINLKFWMFRSNWVTKIMEDSRFNKPATIRNTRGEKLMVSNQLLPEAYREAGRDMVFSEAQMYALGLSEGDLSLVENKIVRLNKTMAQKWTLMINYVNLPNVSKEAIYRQMALESLIEFNREFNSGNIFNASKAMYPTTIDLRAISFDSVMKMLMLNTTGDYSYVTGDVMLKTIENSDLWTSLCLWLTAVLSSKVIPWLRDIALALIFYLGFFTIIHSLTASFKHKAKISCGYLISNLIFAGMTVAYYWIFTLLIGNATYDELLSTKQAVVSLSDPMLICVIIIILSLAYLFGIIKLIGFCIKNYRDMGMQVFSNIMSAIVSKVKGAFTSFKSAISGNGGTSESARQETKDLRGGGEFADDADEEAGEGTAGYSANTVNITAENVNLDGEKGKGRGKEDSESGNEQRVYRESKREATEGEIKRQTGEIEAEIEKGKGNLNKK